MQAIKNITNSPNQSFKFQLPDGSIIFFQMNFVENQAGWFFSLQYKTFGLSNRRIVNSPNFLRAFRRINPEFGMAVFTTDGELMYDPIYLDDFQSGRAVLNILNTSDVQWVEDNLLKRT